MSSVEAARKRWIKERPDHEKFGEVIKARLKKALKPGGFWFEVSARAKDVDSLVKKLLKKSKHNYKSLPDKVGARVILRYRSDIAPAVSLIKKALVCEKEDPKDLGIEKVGYQSVHLDGVSLLDTDPDIVNFPRDSSGSKCKFGHSLSTFGLRCLMTRYTRTMTLCLLCRLR